MNISTVCRSTLVSLMLVTPALHAGHHVTAQKNIVETAVSAGQFETLVAAAKAAGLAGALSGDGPLTVFAPTDEAFSALPAGTVASLLKPENKGQLARVLKFHVIAGRVGSESLADGVAVGTLAGAAVTVTEAESGFTIEGARILTTDIDASNGVVHVIDRVMLPPERISAADATGLIEMAIEQGAPRFNHGDPEATVAIYSRAANALLSAASDEMSQHDVQRLQVGLRSAERAGNAHDAAWQLRYALDDVYDSLSETQMAMRVGR